MSDDQQQPSENLAVFSFGEVEIRVAGTREVPLFCVADVCAALELGLPADAVRNHPEDEKGMETFHTLGGGQKMLSVTEPGLYRLVFRSYKPKAEDFRKWVFREVLPALRNTGHYAMPGRTGEALDTEGRVTTFMVKMEDLVAVANELGLLQEHARGTERSWRTRMGMALRQARGAVLETARGQWEVRQRAGARVSEWILRQTRD